MMMMTQELSSVQTKANDSGKPSSEQGIQPQRRLGERRQDLVQQSILLGW
jgi:hypothetical protein